MLIDIHHHLIYGVDDGPATFEDSCRMLVQAKKQGVSHIIATPHAMPGVRPFPLEDCRARLAQLHQWCAGQGLDLQLHLGAEVFYTSETTRLLDDGRIPTLAGSRYVLVEFSPASAYEHMKRAARRLCNAGYRPVFAHCERYKHLRKIEHMQELHEEYQVLMQVNESAFLRKQGFFTRRWLDHAMDSGLIDAVSSDAHNVSERKCILRDGYAALRSAYGGETAGLLCIETGRRILSGK